MQRPLALPEGVHYWDFVQQVLAQVAQPLPAHYRVTVLTDRFFGNPTFPDLVTRYGWAWGERVQDQTRFRDCPGRHWTLRHGMPSPGRRWKGRGWVFRKGGWREASVMAFWGQYHREPLIVASNLWAGWELLRLYQYRGAIECLFRDWGSAGRQW